MRVLFFCFAMTALAGCSSNGAAECGEAGGQCVLGGGPCRGTEGPQDCNPYVNPGGAFCCLPCPTGQTPNDAGLPTTGCH